VVVNRAGGFGRPNAVGRGGAAEPFELVALGLVLVLVLGLLLLLLLELGKESGTTAISMAPVSFVT